MIRKYRNMYHDPDKTDLEVLRRDARKNSSDLRFTDSTPVVVIHMHRQDRSCEGESHETYVDGKLS